MPAAAAAAACSNLQDEDYILHVLAASVRSSDRQVGRTTCIKSAGRTSIGCTRRSHMASVAAAVQALLSGIHSLWLARKSI